ncbi:tetratricopeptide repeat protein [Peptoniphilus asaccharolyticus]
MIEKKIKDKIKDIVFIELKKTVKVKDLEIKKEIPLPVKMTSLLEGIQTGKLEEEFDLLRVTEGIVFLLGIEPDFKYAKEYRSIVEVVHSNVKDYILYLSKYYLDNKNLIESYIYLNAQDALLDYDADLFFTRLGVLEQIYNENIELLEDEEKQEIVSKLLKGYEDITKKEEYPLALYKLGHINTGIGNHLKAMLYFKKFLNFDSNDELKNEVRVNMEELEDYARMEEGEAYLRYGKFREAENAFNRISESYYEVDKVSYYKSIINYHLSNYEEAYELIEEAIEKVNREEYYNHAALVSVALDNIDQSIAWYEKGLEEFNRSYTLNYNLGLLYYNLKDKKYKDYFQKAYEIEPSEQLLSLLK